MGNTVRIEYDEFAEIDTRAVDDRSRLTLGNLVGKSKRVQVLMNSRGEVLLRPMVEIPASEHWLFQNTTALESVKLGLKDVAQGKVTRLKVEEL